MPGNSLIIHKWGYPTQEKHKYMKQLMPFLLLMLVCATNGYSQRNMPERREGMERIHAAKMAYITDRLNLTTEQSAGFIPVYKEYEEEVKRNRKEFLQKYKGVDVEGADDATAMQYVDDNLDYQEKVIVIKRKYNDRFLKVISPQQISELNKAEREFKQILMKRLEERRNQRHGGGGRWR